MERKSLIISLVICLLWMGSLLFPRQAAAAVPTAPSHLSAGAADATSIALSWEDNSSNEVTFNIYRKTADTAYVMIGQAEPNHTIYGDSGLQPGTTYSYVVKACNSSGLSASSNTAAATTETAVVTVTSPNGGETWKALEEHDITWTSNGEGFQAQLRYRVGSGTWIDIETVPNTNSYSWTIPNVNSNQVRVVVRLLLDGDVVCLDQSDANFTIQPFTVTLEPYHVLGAPAAPSDLECSYTIPNLILNWTDNSSNETGFIIERRVGSGAYAQIGTVTENITTFNDPDTETGQSYTYRVCAYNSVGNSPYSNDNTMVMPVQYVTPSTPHELTAAPESSTTILLSWDAGLGDGVEIERKTASTAFAYIGQLGIAEEQITDHSLAENTTYIYRIRAYTNKLDGSRIYSEYSNEATATPGQEALPVEEEEHTATAGQTVLRFTIDSAEYYVKTPSDMASYVQTMDTAPIISGGRTLLPIRYVSEPLGADVDWDGALDQVTVRLDGQTIVLWINNNTARVNGVETLIDPSNPAVTPIIVPSGRTMLPLRFIAENLGCQVDWNGAISEVTVTYPPN